MKEHFLIIADDLTGACDSGMQMRRRGYRTEVVFAGDKPSDAEAVVIDTRSRTADPVRAYDLVESSIRSIRFSDHRYVIKKVDSTLRGNIPEEVRAVDEAYAPELIVFAPAFPDLGRTTEKGIHHLNGVPVTQTELSKDPKNPVREDSLKVILNSVYDETVHEVGLEQVRNGEIAFDDGRIYIFDAVTNDDLLKIVEAAEKSEKRVLYIGSAGIVDNIMRSRKPTAPALAVVASLSSVTNAQVRYCEQAGSRLVRISVHDILLKEQGPDSFLRETIDSLRSGKDTLLVTDTAYDREGLKCSEEAGRQIGMDLSQIGSYIQGLLGKLTRRILEEVEISGMVISGGDTAQGILHSLEAEGAEICAEVLTGIPMVRLIGGVRDGLKVITKAGAFGKEDAVAFAMRKLKEA